jgi:hypothetical protein
LYSQLLGGLAFSLKQCISPPSADKEQHMSLAPSSHTQQVGGRARIIQELCTLAKSHGARGPYLDVGVGSPEKTVLLEDQFKSDERRAVGSHASTEVDGLVYSHGNPNDMRELYKDGQFSTVFWGGALARDKFFWRTLSEIKRVLAPQGVFLVSAPAFTKVARFGLQVISAKGNEIPNATVTARADDVLPDYLRFSPRAIREMIFDGFDVREVRVALVVPRVFGVGVKKG